MNYNEKIKELLKHRNVSVDLTKKELIQKIIEKKEAKICKSGALVAVTPPESTGRSPKNTFIVKNGVSEKIDWDSPNNIALTQKAFNSLFEDAIKTLKEKKELIVSNKCIGADEKYSLKVKTISDRALSILFTENMFRTQGDLTKSIFKKEFTLLVLPYNKLNEKKYSSLLPSQDKSMAVAMDFENLIGIIFGSAYMGSMKKLIFTVMNYLLPEVGVLPIHCSANEGKKGDCALLLGLSGTGKTTLSADPNRALLGDDEHGWSDKGIFNFEAGCYAKLINLRKEKEPEIFDAVMHKAPYLEHGAIMENVAMDSKGKIDFFDDSITPNSRGSYPLEHLSNIKPSSTSTHPKTILFLTADANGVLPPISMLSKEQAMLWFLMGYTSKLAGTETGITEPVSTFSRFFGQPFMPRNPNDYIELFGKKLEEHEANVYLINTGWSGGPYGIGKRMDINDTRAMVEAALKGKLENTESEENKLFHLMIPKKCPRVESNILNPINTWKDKKEFQERANKLAKDFSDYFDKMYSGKGIPEKVIKECPGK
ncbi:MAG: phosphoenolpyruvate carboxykinase (ATP) [Candidatus Diapherotrites archaeon]